MRSLTKAVGLSRGATSAFLFVFFLAACNTTDPVVADTRREDAPLRTLAAVRDLRIGSVYQNNPDERYNPLFVREYNVMTVYNNDIAANCNISTPGAKRWRWRLFHCDGGLRKRS